MDTATLETQRLLLRAWRASDADHYLQFFSDAQAARYVGGACDADTAWRRLAMQIGHWSLRGHGYWAVSEKAGGAFAGSVGLWRSAGWPELELGFWLVPAAWGKGYATEAGAAARDYAFDVLDSASLVSYIHPDNRASVRVAERLGARADGELELLTHGRHIVYRYERPGRTAD